MEFVVEGEHAILEHLSHRRKNIVSLHCKHEVRSKYAYIVEKFGVKLIESSGTHSGHSRAPIWARVRIEYLSENGFFARISKQPDPLLVALDHITDPRNLGAIVRSCAFFGVRHVMIPTHRQVGITSSAVDAAQGGFSLVDVVKVTNLARALIDLKERNGYWIFGTALDGGVSVDQKICELKPAALVLGAEDKGVSKKILENSDVNLIVRGAASAVQSLNVAVAAGILISQLKA